MKSPSSRAERRSIDAIIIIVIAVLLRASVLLFPFFRSLTNTAATIAYPTMGEAAYPIPNLSLEPTVVPTAVPQESPTPLPDVTLDASKMPSPGIYPAPPQPTPNPTDPWNTTTFPEPVNWSPKEYTAYVQFVVRAKVSGIGEPRWNTEDGKRPANPFDDTSRYFIYHLVTVQVSTVLKGQLDVQELTLYVAGGVIGKDFLEVSPDINAYKQGEEVILFLNEHNVDASSGKTTYTAYDRYTVSGDQAKNIFRELPVDELIEQIQSAV